MTATATTTADRPTLTSLAVAAQAGSARARDALLRGLTSWLTRTLFKEVRARGLGLDDADVEDVAQEILLDVWRTDLMRYQADKGDFLGFVMARVRWRLTDEVRRRARRSFVSLDAPVAEGREYEAVGARPDEKREEAARELKLILLPSLLERALAEDDGARYAVRAYHLEDRPLRDVAADLGVHVSNACRARKRGLALLKKRLPAELRFAA